MLLGSAAYFRASVSGGGKDGGPGEKQRHQNVEEENAAGCHDIEGLPRWFYSLGSAFAVCPWNVSPCVSLDPQPEIQSIVRVARKLSLLGLFICYF